jgi:hypothetical protein
VGPCCNDYTLIIDVVPAEGEPWHQEIRYGTTPWGEGDSVSVLLGDMDQDGRADLIVYDDFNLPFALYVGTAQDGGFADPEQWYVSDREVDYVQYDVADFDGDGNDDILASFEGDGPGDDDSPWLIDLQLLTSDGSAITGTGDPRPLADEYPQSVRLYGDLDGDGADEPLLVGADGFATVDIEDPTSTEITPVWEVDPANTAWQRRYESYSTAATADWVMSDVDGDGDDDLVYFRFSVQGGGVASDSRPATVRLAEDGKLGEPVPWGSFDCRPNCGTYDYAPVTPAF